MRPSPTTQEGAFFSSSPLSLLRGRLPALHLRALHLSCDLPLIRLSTFDLLPLFPPLLSAPYADLRSTRRSWECQACELSSIAPSATATNPSRSRPKRKKKDEPTLNFLLSARALPLPALPRVCEAKKCQSSSHPGALPALPGLAQAQSLPRRRREHEVQDPCKSRYHAFYDCASSAALSLSLSLTHTHTSAQQIAASRGKRAPRCRLSRPKRTLRSERAIQTQHRTTVPKCPATRESPSRSNR